MRAVIAALDVSGSAPVPSTRFAATRIHAADLVDSAGARGDAARPIGFGFFLNDILIAEDRLGFALVNAGGSDTAPTCSNVVVFDPKSGGIRQVVDLATLVPAPGAGLDSAGTPVPGGIFRQSGAEGLEYVPGKNGARGLLLVAMSNFVFGAPSYGAVKYPGTVEVFDVDPAAGVPVIPRNAGVLSTQVLPTRDFNPVAVSRLANPYGNDRLLITVAGTTGYDAAFRLVPVTPASVEAYDAVTLAFLGRFELGLAGLSAARPALGNDGVGHAVGYFASSVKGEVYLLRLDGLVGYGVDASKVAVVRGPNNGIPIDPASAGGPGGNVAGLALSAGGDVLLASGFGDFFAFPAPKPGRLYALSLPVDVIGTPQFPRTFLPGTANLVTASGRTLGPVVIAPGAWSSPEVYVAVSGSLDGTTFLGTSPASLGSLDTHGRIR